MIDSDRTGPDANRDRLMSFEPNNFGGGPNTAGGAHRLDKWTGETLTSVDVGTDNFQRGDASRCTSWGGWLTGEENWNPGGATSSPSGRL
jgi:hypothetical protein